MIVQTDPHNWQDVNTVQVDSDARDNDQALREIDAWAASNGFLRTDEYWLRQIIKKDGRRVFRGICYRVTDEIRESNGATLREIAEVAARNPLSNQDERR
jgi:hypothetical protein